MAKWIIKAALQRSFSLFPNPEAVNRLFQRYLTGQDKLNDVKFENKLMHAHDHLAYLKKYAPSADLSTLRCLELGTGQFPIVPLYYYLHGINEVVSIDIISFMTPDRIGNTLDYFEDFRKRQPEKFGRYMAAMLPERWDKLMAVRDKLTTYPGVAEVLQEFGARILVKDARDSGFERDHFDFITSNNTFEHIYPEILDGILKEFYRILKPGGVMSHFIDMTDHFAHFDPAINVYNFLRFSPRFWRMIDNEILPQSRLRLKDYEGLYARENIPVNEVHQWPYRAALLQQVPIHSCWAGYTPDELAVVHVYMITLK